MAIPKGPLNPVPWEQGSFLQVKVEDEEESSISQSQEISPSPMAHPEAARLCFPHFHYEEVSSPHQALAQLRELCYQWLRPESSSKEQMLEQLVLEQFLGALPPEIQAWVGAQCPKSGKEAAVLVEDLTQLLDQRSNGSMAGWEPGVEPEEAVCKQNSSEESQPPDMATKTHMGGVSPKSTSVDTCDPEGSSENQIDLLRPIWMKFTAQEMDFSKALGPHMDTSKDQPGHESVASGNSPNTWPNFTSQEKALSEEKFGPLDDCGTVPPDTYLEKKHSKCGECRKTFRNSSSLEAHQKSHSWKMPYACIECGKAFSQSTHLTQHQVVHIGAKPHACKDCGKAFSRVTHLTQHQRIHTGEKPYRCEECGKTFSRSTHLTQHQCIHTGEKPYRCEVCGRAFSDCSALIRHLRIHSGEKPYQCKVCPKAFAQSSSLIEHQWIHMGEKPYRCSDCGKAFSRSSALMMHLKIHITVLQ